MKRILIALVALALCAIPGYTAPARLTKMLLAPTTQGAATTTTAGIYCRGAREIHFTLSAFRVQTTLPTFTVQFATIDTATFYTDAGTVPWAELVVKPTSLDGAATSSTFVNGGFVGTATEIVSGSIAVSVPLRATFVRVKVVAADSVYSLAVRATALWGGEPDFAQLTTMNAVISLAGCAADSAGGFITVSDSTSLANIPIGSQVFDLPQLRGGRKCGATYLVERYTNGSGRISPPPFRNIGINPNATTQTLTFVLP